MTIESEVPDEHPEKDAIEEALKESLQGAPGDWRIEIALATAFTPPWWLVSFEGLGERFCMSFRPMEQRASYIQECVRKAMTRRKLIE